MQIPDAAAALRVGTWMQDVEGVYSVTNFDVPISAFSNQLVELTGSQSVEVGNGPNYRKRHA